VSDSASQAATQVTRTVEVSVAPPPPPPPADDDSSTCFVESLMD